MCAVCRVSDPLGLDDGAMTSPALASARLAVTAATMSTSSKAISRTSFSQKLPDKTGGFLPRAHEALPRHERVEVVRQPMLLTTKARLRLVHSCLAGG
jgi:hypothetical protein